MGRMLQPTEVKEYAQKFGISVFDLFKHAHKVVIGFEPRNGRDQTDANDFFGPTHRIPVYVTTFIRMRKTPQQMPGIP